MTADESFQLKLPASTNTMAMGLKPKHVASPEMPFPAKPGTAFYGDIINFASERGGSDPHRMSCRVTTGELLAFISRRHLGTLVPLDSLAETLRGRYNPDYARVAVFYAKELNRSRNTLAAPSKPRSAKACYKDLRKAELLAQDEGADVSSNRLTADAEHFLKANNETWGPHEATATLERNAYRNKQELFLSRFWKQDPLPPPWTNEAKTLELENRSTRDRSESGGSLRHRPRSVSVPMTSGQPPKRGK